MAFPCYVSTEWKELDRASLRFRPKKEITHVSEMHVIDCYLSAVYIKEYGERKRKGAKRCEGTSESQVDLVKPIAPSDRQEVTLEHQNAADSSFTPTNGEKSDRRPPGVAPEVWKKWQEYWETWKEILIPLSFVHKYRDQCTPEHIEWHDSYLKNFPDVLPLITDGLGKNEWSENTTKQSSAHETSQSNAELDFTEFFNDIHGENYQNGQNGSGLEEPVDGETEISMEQEHTTDKLKRSGCEEGPTNHSPEHKTSQSDDDTDFAEFFDYLCGKENEQGSQNCNEAEAAEISAVGTSVEQKYAPRGSTCEGSASESSGGENGKKNRKVLDELYEKHEEMRYWVHLRSFLLDHGVECGPDIEVFFEREAGVWFSIQSSTKLCSDEVNSTKEFSPVTGGKLREGEGEDKKVFSQSKDEKIPQTEHASDNFNEDKSNKSYVSSQCDKENNYKCWQKQIEDLKETMMEKSAVTPTTEEVLPNNLSDPQELGNNNCGRENFPDNSACEENERIELGVMEATSSISNGGGGMQTVEADSIHSTSCSLDQKQKTSRKSKRKRDKVRPQGLAWALRYVQKNDAVSAEEPGQSSGTAPEPPEAAPESPEAAPESPDVALESPEAAPEFPEVSSVSPEGVPGSSETVPGSPEAFPVSSEAASDIPERVLGSSETISGSTEAAPVSPAAASVSPKAAPVSPEAAPVSSEAAPESPEASPGSPEAAPESPKASPWSPDASSESSDNSDAMEEVDTSDDSETEEEKAMEWFFEDMAERDKRFWKKYNKELERKAQLKASLSQQVTGLSHLQAACQATMDKAVAALREVFMPLTALHCLNLSFPGAAAIEYESSVTEEVLGERERLKFRFDSVVYDTREKFKHYFKLIGKFCLTTWMDAVVPVGLSHLTNLLFLATQETELQFPPTVFGMRWLPEPEPSFRVDGKNVQRCLRRFHKWLKVQDPNLLPSVTVELRGLIMNRVNYSEEDPRKAQRMYQQVVREEEEEGGRSHLTLHTLHLLEDDSKTGEFGGDGGEVECPRMEVTFDKDGNFCVADDDSALQQPQDTEGSKAEAEAKAEAENKLWQRIISNCRRLTFWETDNSLPPGLPQEIHKYWAQRYRLFLKYDEGIKLDTESWYSVTPELLAAHHAWRCRCEVVVDALCGAGGNAIQLAKTCGHVIAIDKDPNKVRLARHNAEVYGVADRIDFRVGDFFKLAPYLKADVVFMSPPWGGMEYLKESVYNVYRLGGTMNCVRLMRAAQDITPNVALYLPRNSNLCQVIALAGVGGVVDIEANFMGPKKKAITAYFGDLANKAGWYEC